MSVTNLNEYKQKKARKKPSVIQCQGENEVLLISNKMDLKGCSQVTLRILDDGILIGIHDQLVSNIGPQTSTYCETLLTRQELEDIWFACINEWE